MNTGSLIEYLARHAGPARPFAATRRLSLAALGGMAASVLMARALHSPLPEAIFHTSAPWIKLAYALALAGAALVLTARLARPLARLHPPRRMVLAVVLCMLALGTLALIVMPPGQWRAAVLGRTWWICPWLLTGFSMPALLGTLYAVRGLAPVRCQEAGFACGLLAGALGAVGYALVCPESSATFVAIWYTLGMGLTALLGRVLGPWVLRW